MLLVLDSIWFKTILKSIVGKEVIEWELVELQVICEIAFEILREHLLSGIDSNSQNSSTIEKAVIFRKYSISFAVLYKVQATFSNSFLLKEIATGFIGPV